MVGECKKAARYHPQPMPAKLPESPVPTLRTVELTTAWEPALQHFFDANPAYFQLVHGEPARPGEAMEEIVGDLPAGWAFTTKWVVGFVDDQDAVVAMANMVSDLLAPGVWHLGLFLVASSRHGNGEAHALYKGLEAWAASQGANWLRLGVVQGNVRGERFWEFHGYLQTRTRVGVQMGQLTNTVRVMVKPLAGGTLAQYLHLIHRDRPDPMESAS